MTHKELRKKYIDFFTVAPRSHREIPSASLVPENDPTTLFISSGMQPLMPYLLGEKHPLGTRLVNSQKCFRAQDIDEVGDNRHTTFFEMLGNWSLGSYFKKEQLPWFFEFLTNVLKLPTDKLYVTVFEGNEFVSKDTESIEIWKKIFSRVGIVAKEGERIFSYPVDKNWWSRSGVPSHMPPGEPGGPDSEVFFDFGTPHDNTFGPQCHPNCNCGRFLEIGNSVFMQYQKQNDGNFKALPQRNVDFGGGLERLIAAVSNEPDIFNIDVYKPIIQAVEKETSTQYSLPQNKSAMRVIADHIKAATFLIADGVIPSNKEQGYVLRRLLRRAAVKMHHLKGGFASVPHFSQISSEIIHMYDGIYFDKNEVLIKVSDTIDSEMNKFAKTLDYGLKVLKNTKKIDGKTAFDLYQTYGFPIEITKEILLQQHASFDDKEFHEEFIKHQELSRTASKGMFKGGLSNHSQIVTQLHTATHLLQQALRDVLGTHIRQKGSHINSERLRFDFSHQNKLTEEQIRQIETLVNEKILENLPVSMDIVPLKQAVAGGALTVPNVVYPEKVKVYSVGNFSKEVCGGPHVDFTGSLGSFKIVKEEAIGSQIRRIYATLHSHVTARKDLTEKARG